MTEVTLSLDLHVLSPPLTFALSQDQTLHMKRWASVALIAPYVLAAFRHGHESTPQTAAGVRRTERNIYPSFARCEDTALGTTAVIFYFEEGLFPTVSLVFQPGDYRVLTSILLRRRASRFQQGLATRPRR